MIAKMITKMIEPNVPPMMAENFLCASPSGDPKIKFKSSNESSISLIKQEMRLLCHEKYLCHFH